MNQYNDIRQVDRSALAAAQAAFFRSGGKVEEIEAYQDQPKPPRIEPLISQEERDRRAFVEQVREMGKTMSKTQMVMRLGVSLDRINRTCRDNGIKCVSGTGKNQKSRGSCVIDPVEDAKLAERLKALAGVGIKKTLAANHIGIGHHKAKRLIATYGIEFKK
jgi:hypothetical protein